MNDRESSGRERAALVLDSEKDLRLKAEKALPVGTVAYFMGPSPPLGWIFDDASYPKREYPELLQAISTEVAVNSETFILPDMSLMFGTVRIRAIVKAKMN